MAQHRVVLLPGDGIGPEITAVARQLLEVVSQRHGFSLSFEEQPIGGSAIDATGEPLPASTLEACKAADAVLLPPSAAPVSTAFPARNGRKPACSACAPAWSCSPICGR